MSEKFKKNLVIIGFIVIVIIIAYAIYYFFFRPAPKPPSYYFTPSTEIIPGQLPSIINENTNRRIEEEYAGLPSIERVPQGAVISDKAKGGYTAVQKKLEAGAFPKVGKDGSLVYYDSSQGRFYKRNADGSITLLTAQRFYAVSRITWSDDAAKAVLEYPDGSNIVYDFNENKQSTLPKELQDFDFSNNGQMIAAEAIGQQTENNWIVTSNPDGANIQFIERIGDQANNVDVNISPNNQVVATYRENASAGSQEIVFIGQQGENFKSMVVNGLGFAGQWTPSGEKLLYSAFQPANGFRPTLSLSGAFGDYIGAGNIDLGLQTWSDKCAISADSSSAYCAVPQNLPEGSGWYPELAQNLPDTFYKVDLTSGQTTLLAEPVGNQPFYSAASVFLSPDGKTLYFQDQSGSVYGINLP
ncbi:hypothetical protein KJ840_03880 [Patescibacteria group bacterium]|nr:hypothetical protein [Patescibacteria group bacterium]